MLTIGLDFDNTIVCYDTVFHTVAAERKLVPATPVMTKEEVRNFLRSKDQEQEWIELQGIVYGSEILKAPPFPGALEFIAQAVNNGITVYIISHKTLKPFAGPQVNLHDAARSWLHKNNVFSASGAGLPEDHAFFEETLQGKLARIGKQQCGLFVDDLPELLSEENFPPSTKRILFDPNSKHIDSVFPRLHSWSDLNKLMDTLSK